MISTDRFYTQPEGVRVCVYVCVCGNTFELTSGDPFNDSIYYINDICCLINVISGTLIEREAIL